MDELDRLQLSTVVLNPKIVYHEVLESTNDFAKTLIERGLGKNSIIVARHQTKGRGRFDKNWESPVGGLYLSIILEPSLPADRTPLLGLLLSCAVVDAIKKVTGVQATIKWPNDILIDDRKVGGILSELVTHKDNIFVILGVGVNVNTTLQDYSLELQPDLISLRESLQEAIPLELFVSTLVTSIDDRLNSLYDSNDFDVVLDEWRELTSTLGRTVRVLEGTSILEGVALDIASDGSLIVSLNSGEDVTMSAGEVFHIDEGRVDH